MVQFVGAGPGAPDLITVRGKKLLEEADVVIYAGSLVNPELLTYTKEGCRIFDSSEMTLDEITAEIVRAEQAGLMVVRLHTGDTSLYSALREQIDALKEFGIETAVTPGVSAFCGAAASLQEEYTLPGLTQSVVITRAEGRTKVPEAESLRSFAAHGSTMVLFLSASQAEQVEEELITGGFSPETPAAVVCKATWPGEEKILRTTLGKLAEEMKRAGIFRTALIIVGRALRGGASYEKSRLYSPDFSTGYREADISSGKGGREEQDQD